MTAAEIGAKKLWDILGENGWTVGVINVPTEYPPSPVNGFLICGALTPDPSSEYTYPARLKDEILRIAPDYQCEIEYGRLPLDELAAPTVLAYLDTPSTEEEAPVPGVLLFIGRFHRGLRGPTLPLQVRRSDRKLPVPERLHDLYRSRKRPVQNR